MEVKRIEDLGISLAPWTICDFCVDHIGVASSSGRRVADVCSTANARLIAAAPDLYEALRMFVELCESYGCDKKCEDCLCAERQCMIKARAALAKAAGAEAIS